MNYSMKDILDSLTPEKRKADGTMTRFLYRPVSYPASWLFLRLRLSPNSVTYLSAICCIVAFIAVLFPATVLHRTAIALFFVFAVLDCADGNMARTLKRKTTYGGWVDAAGGYLAYATQLFAMGMSAFFQNGDAYRLPVSGFVPVLPWGAATWILLGAIAAVSNVLMRLFYQAFKNAGLIAGKATQPGNEKRFSEEIGITGYLPVLYAAGFATGNLPPVIALYAIVYTGGFFVTTLKLVIKASREK